MNKSKVVIVATMLLLGAFSANAQSLKNLFSSDGEASDVVTSVTGGLTVSADKIVGQWDYVKPAVELSSESVASTAAGSLAATQIETKLDSYCSKIGIKAGAFAFVFNADNTFTSNIGSRKLGGTYTVDAESGAITFNYEGLGMNIGKMTASTTLTSTSLSLVFNANKLLSFLKALGSKSSNGELGLLSSLSSEYSGLQLGFELKGEVVESVSGKVEQVESTVNAISKWFK